MKLRTVALWALLSASSAFADPIFYAAYLNGPNEFPPNASPGTGVALVSYDAVSHLLTVDATFSGLLANTTAAHIHCCTTVAGTGAAGVATQTPSFIGFPLGVTSGTFSNTYDLTLASSFRSGFITLEGAGTVAGAEAAFATGLANGKTYFNIHSSLFPGGEIRGFLTPVPEPGTFLLLGTVVTGLAVLGRRRKSS